MLTFLFSGAQSFCTLSGKKTLRFQMARAEEWGIIAIQEKTQMKQKILFTASHRNTERTEEKQETSGDTWRIVFLWGRQTVPWVALQHFLPYYHFLFNYFSLSYRLTSFKSMNSLFFQEKRSWTTMEIFKALNISLCLQRLEESPPTDTFNIYINPLTSRWFNSREIIKHLISGTRDTTAPNE